MEKIIIENRTDLSTEEMPDGLRTAIEDPIGSTWDNVIEICAEGVDTMID